jgi:hypothetical protein
MVRKIARITGGHMVTVITGPAVFDVKHGCVLFGCQVVVSSVLFAVTSEDICYFKIAASI